METALKKLKRFQTIHVRLNDDELAAIDESLDEDMDRSRFVRRAIRRELEREPEQAER